jgi:hypothetical protein
MGLVGERMNALGEIKKEAERKAKQGDAKLNAKNTYSGWAKEFIGMLALLVVD